jgi:hypothetical protein
MLIFYILRHIFVQMEFHPADIKHSSLRTMAKHVRRAMLPVNLVNCCCVAALDDRQVLVFYWIYPIDAMKRMVPKLQYKGKLYAVIEPGCLSAFDQSNPGMMFQGSRGHWKLPSIGLVLYRCLVFRAKNE